MTNRITTLAAVMAVAFTLALTSCKTRTLEPGGVYAPTNALGQVVYTDTGLALADAAYKFAYETVCSPLKFERDNRAAIFALSPSVGVSVKHALDDVRVQVWAIDQRWAVARKAYRASPTPAGLTTIQTILAEVQRLIPVVQSQLAPVYTTLATNPVNP
jgi:hypothetical protein